MKAVWETYHHQLIEFAAKDVSSITNEDLDAMIEATATVKTKLKECSNRNQSQEDLVKTSIMAGVDAYISKLNKIWPLQDGGFYTRILRIKLRLYGLLVTVSTMNESKIHLQMVEAGITKRLADDTVAFRKYYQRVKAKKDQDMMTAFSDLIMQGFFVIDNCTRTRQLRPAIKEQVFKPMCQFVDPDENFIDHVIVAISIIERIHPTNGIHKMLFPEAFLQQLIKVLRSTGYSRKWGVHAVDFIQTESHIELDTFLLVLGVFAKHDDYRCIYIDKLKEHQDFLDELLRKGTDLEQSYLHKFLLQLAKHSCNKCNCMYIVELLLKHGVHVEAETPRPGTATPARPVRLFSVSDAPKKDIEIVKFKCKYMTQCYNFLQTLNIKDVYLDSDYHRCFCSTCFAERSDQEVYTRGDPPMKYALPQGWVKFALKTSPRATAMEIWSKWHVAFHGTRSENVEKILQAGDLLMPEDKTPDGKTLSPPSGHFTEDRKPDGFNVKQVFLSPSIRYSGKPVYAPQTSFEDPDTKSTLYGRVALQVRIKPDSYEVAKETTGASMMGERVDPHFTNLELEWSTDCRGVVILVGIIIKVETEADED